MREYQVEDFLPVGEAGEYRIERFVVTGKEWQGFTARTVPAGTYTRLMRGETVVMSDTPSEWRDHCGIVAIAEGRVLVAGLGIGMVARALLRKPEVTHLTVVELAPEVIELTAPHLKALYGDKLEVVQGDILEWKPPKDARWDCGWYDIWDDISPDNLPDMKRLHRRFGTKVRYQASWARGLCELAERNERRWER